MERDFEALLNANSHLVCLGLEAGTWFGLSDDDDMELCLASGGLGDVWEAIWRCRFGLIGQDENADRQIAHLVLVLGACCLPCRNDKQPTSVGCGSRRGRVCVVCIVWRVGM